MTKEELENEAEEIYLKTDKEFMDCQDEGEIFNLGYLASAEPREKQIQIDAEQIRALQKQNGELTDRVKELEAQIEKMKCCENCGKEFTKECVWWKRAEENRQINTCKDWEIKEK